MTPLPQELHRFIAEAIDSVESLEILLLLRRSPDTFWASTAVAQQLGLSQAVADARLRNLQKGELVVSGSATGAFAYAVKSAERHALVDRLALAYAEQRIHVINTIYSENLERLRAFSNAFRLKG